MSQVDQKNFEELCAGYVLDSLTESDKELFLQLLEQSSTQQKVFFEEMKGVASELALLSPAQAPDETLKQTLIRRVWSTIQRSNVKYLTRYRYSLAAAVLFLISTVGLGFYSQNLTDKMTSSSRELAKYETVIERLGDELSQKEELLTILEARDVDLVMMNGLEVNPGGYGKVVWDKDNDRALLQVSNLPAAPSDKDYQLWLIVNNQPISAGVFSISEPVSNSFFKVDELSHDLGSGAFAITMEPKGGVPQPTGDMYLLGS